MNLLGALVSLGAVAGGIKGLHEAFGKATSPTRSTQTIRAPNGLTMKAYTVNNIDQRVKHCVDMIQKGRNDPRVRAVAVQVVSQKRRDGKWTCRERDYVCECRAMFDYVRQHVRYVRDSIDRDTFQHPKRTLEFGGGDCFPEGTLFLTPGGFVPVEHVEVGDIVHSGSGWVQVLKTWDRGPKTILEAELDNGCTLRLSDNHKVFRVPRTRGTAGIADAAEKIHILDMKVGDELLQPRSFSGGDGTELSEDEAYLVGAYLAEGYGRLNRKGEVREVSIAGIPNSKGIRERVIDIYDRHGIEYRSPRKEVIAPVDQVYEAFPSMKDLGRIAAEKRLPHFQWGPRTMATILSALEQGDGGLSTSGSNMVFSTVSDELALDYRVMHRMVEGRSTSLKTLKKHGGLGKKPIHRLTVRQDHQRRPWAKVKSIRMLDEQEHCYDLMVEGGQVYLPEIDIVVSNCDDYTITLGALLQSIGYPVWCRVIRTVGHKDFNHIYLVVGLPPTNPTHKMSLDASVDRPAGWAPPASMIVQTKDYAVP